MHIGVLPAIPQIGLIRIENSKPPSEEYAESLGRFTVVFVDFGKALRKIEHDTVDRMIERYLDQRMVREDARDLPSK